MGVVFSTDTDDSGLGADGTVHNNAWKQAMATAVNAVVADAVTVSYSAGNFTASTGSWTVDSGDVLLNRYQIINKILFWQIALTTTSVSATPTSLRIAIPSGTFLSVQDYSRVAYALDNSTYREAICVPVDGTHLYLAPTSVANWATSTNTTSIYISSYFWLA
jgi:hypothetical protein